MIEMRGRGDEAFQLQLTGGVLNFSSSFFRFATGDISRCKYLPCLLRQSECRGKRITIFATAKQCRSKYLRRPWSAVAQP